ncbi:MAG: hypothetical protein ACOCP8_02985 [archaeon]
MATLSSTTIHGTTKIMGSYTQPEEPIFEVKNNNGEILLTTRENDIYIHSDKGLINLSEFINKFEFIFDKLADKKIISKEEINDYLNSIKIIKELTK